LINPDGKCFDEGFDPKPSCEQELTRKSIRKRMLFL